jgi:hypothetical protein
MDIGSILLILSLLALVALFVARPFLENRRKPEGLTGEEDHEFSSLLAERDRVINALQELDFDHVAGKIPAEIYPEQRKQLLGHGAEVLRKIDTYLGEASVTAEERLEAAVAVQKSSLEPAYSRSGNGGGYPSSDTMLEAEDALEIEIANRRRARSAQAGGFCPKCGKPVQKNDRFCPKCGTAL